MKPTQQPPRNQESNTPLPDYVNFTTTRHDNWTNIWAVANARTLRAHTQTRIYQIAEAFTSPDRIDNDKNNMGDMRVSVFGTLVARPQYTC